MFWIVSSKYGFRISHRPLALTKESRGWSIIDCPWLVDLTSYPSAPHLLSPLSTPHIRNYLCFTTSVWAQDINWWSRLSSLFDVKSIINFLLAGNFDVMVKSRRFFYTGSTASSSWPAETESAAVVFGLLSNLLIVGWPQGRRSVSETRIPCSFLYSLFLFY